MADSQDNRVAFVRPGSLAIVETVKYPVEGYLKGAIGMEQEGRKFIYLWFSSGSIILVEGLTGRLISQISVSDDSQIKSLTTFSD